MTQRSVRAIVQALNDAQVRYMAVGGVAVNAHGFMRLTSDVDLLIQLVPENVIAALNALATLGYRPNVPVTPDQFANAENRRRWIEEKGMKVLKLFADQHRETDIDVFVDDPLGFDDAYTRVMFVSLADGTPLPVCGYSDLVKLKLAASRPKDLDDLKNLRIKRGET